MIKLHRWGATFLPKGGGAVARELETRRRAPSPPPRPRPSIAPAAGAAAEAEVVPLHEAPAVSVPARRPLREKDEPAAGSKATAEADMSAGESPVATVVEGSGGTWLRVSPKTTVRSPSLQTDTSNESPRSVADSPALSVAADDKYVWADKYRPNVLNEFICNKTVAAELYQLVITRPHCKRCFS
jgi:replication factor C subunit 3/5